MFTDALRGNKVGGTPISPTPALSRGYEVTSPTPPSWIAWYLVSPVLSSSLPSLLELIPHLSSHQTFTLKPVSIHLVLIYFLGIKPYTLAVSIHQWPSYWHDKTTLSDPLTQIQRPWIPGWGCDGYSWQYTTLLRKVRPHRCWSSQDKEGRGWQRQLVINARHSHVYPSS
jgi:hypothetical protein